MNILDKFRQTTNYNLHQFFVDHTYFLDNYLHSLISYFKGESTLNKNAYKELLRLYGESIKIEEVISLCKANLSSTTEFWDLVDDLSLIKTKLETYVNLPKWMRSSYVYGYDGQSKFKYIMKQSQTVEGISYEMGSQDPNQDWVEVALSNSLMEADYTKEGGNVLDVMQTDNTAFNITSVVDVMVGDNILGKDWQQKIQITAEDIVSLGTVDTMEQSAEICLTTVRGSVPEFMDLGISKNFVGSNKNSLRFPSLVREVLGNFNTDDSFKSVELVNNGIEQDVAFYEFKIVSRLNNEVNKTL